MVNEERERDEHRRRVDDKEDNVPMNTKREVDDNGNFEKNGYNRHAHAYTYHFEKSQQDFKGNSHTTTVAAVSTVNLCSPTPL